MRAAVLTGPREIEIHDVPGPPQGGPGDVLLQVDAVGVCGSDLHYFRTGRIGSAVVTDPFIMGHECAGTILEVGADVRAVEPGQRVAVDPLLPCGTCDQCISGRPHTCRNQRFLGYPGQLDGALVEYLVVPEGCCHPVPASMTRPQAALVEPVSIGVYAQRLSGLEEGDTIAILGSGPIGLAVLLACRAAATCTTYVTDLIPERLALASELGAAWTGSPRRTDVVRAIRDAEPLGVDLAFECAGEQETLDQAVALLAPGGTLVIVGIPETDRVTFPAHVMRRKELTLRNVRRQNQCMDMTIDLMTSGRIDADAIVTHHFRLEEALEAFQLVADYRDGVVKALIEVTRS